MSTSSNNLPLSFRQAEITCLFGWLQAGESASVIGASGIGKSNLFNHLLDPQIQATYLGDRWHDYLFVRVNFHYVPDFTDRSIYSLILEQFELMASSPERLGLEPTVIEYVGQQHEALLNAGQDVLKVQRCLKLAIRAILVEPKRRLILLFDQFDPVYQEASLRLFAQLRGLREAYKYRLSYVVFTRDRLPILAAHDSGREEFYELLAPNVIGLKPYAKEDAILMLQRVASRLKLPLEESLMKLLYHLTGGHAGLLRSAFLSVTQGGFRLPSLELEACQVLLAQSSIELECFKIWNSLSLDERRGLAYIAHGSPVSRIDKLVGDQLRLKGLLKEQAEAVIFSPLFALFAQNQEALWERPLFFDAQTRQVLILGRVAPALTALEYRLFRLLHENQDIVLSKDELIDAGWPEASGGVSDEALTAAMSRLRKKIEPEPDNPRFLENVREQGYRLRVE